MEYIKNYFNEHGTFIVEEDALVILEKGGKVGITVTYYPMTSKEWMSFDPKKENA